MLTSCSWNETLTDQSWHASLLALTRFTRTLSCFDVQSVCLFYASTMCVSTVCVNPQCMSVVCFLNMSPHCVYPQCVFAVSVHNVCPQCVSSIL